MEAIDYSGVKAAADQTDREQLLVGMSCSCGLFERTHALMGFEASLMAMLTDREAYEELLDWILEFKMAYARKLYDATDFDLFYYHDDWGSKRSLFFSVSYTHLALCGGYQQRSGDGRSKSSH